MTDAKEGEAVRWMSPVFAEADNGAVVSTHVSVVRAADYDAVCAERDAALEKLRETPERIAYADIAVEREAFREQAVVALMERDRALGEVAELRGEMLTLRAETDMVFQELASLMGVPDPAVLTAEEDGDGSATYRGKSAWAWWCKAHAYGTMVHGVNPILGAREGEATKDAAARVVKERDLLAARVGQWVKCSERMPEQHQQVLVMAEGEREPLCASWFEWQNHAGVKRRAWHQGHGCIQVNGDATMDPADLEVTHWMELPGAPGEGT